MAVSIVEQDGRLAGSTPFHRDFPARACFLGGRRDRAQRVDVPDGFAQVVTPLLISAAIVASIVTCFAPEQRCADFAIGAIDAAQHEILVNAYVLTDGSGIPAALIRAHGRGVDVRLVADRRAPCDLQEGLDAIATAGIPVWIDAGARMAHEKALIIDRRVTVMGSYNWSKGAARNSEDLNVVTSEEIAQAYAGHWRARQAVSVRFTDASQWCQR